MSATNPALMRACHWLDGWRAEGRGVTIGADGSVTAWWLPEPTLEGQPRALLDQIERDEPLKAAVRAIVYAEATVRSAPVQTGMTVQ